MLHPLRHLCVAIVLAMFTLNLCAQDTLRLSLEEAIDLATAQSPQASIARLEYDAASWDFRAFNSQFRPQISLGGDIPGFSRFISDISQDDGSQVFRTQSRTFSRVGLDLVQPIAFTGGQVRVSSSIFSIFNFEPVDSRLWQTQPLVVELQQPLFQLNQDKWNRQEQYLRMKNAETEYLVTVEGLKQEVTSVYFEALTAQTNRDRAQLNVTNNDTIYRISQGRYSVGKIAENELLQSELRLMSARSELEQATLNYNQAIRQLRIVLGLQRDEELELVVPNRLPQETIDPEVAISEAIKNSDFTTTARLRRFQVDRFVQETKVSNRFQADIRASFGLNQSAEDLSDAYRDPVDRQTFSVGFDVPILNWGRGKAERQAALSRQQSVEEELEQAERNQENDVYFQVMNIRQLRKQLVISSRSDTVAQRRYDISRNRYLIGKISIQDLFIAQQEKDAAQQRYILDLRNFWIAWSELRRITLYNFEEDQPLVIREETSN